MKSLLIAAIALAAALADAANLSPDLEQGLASADAATGLQALITFTGDQPRAEALRELRSITPQLHALSGGRVIGALLPAEEVMRVTRIRTVRTIELFTP